ncbi:MAG: hypothetical protein U5N58_07605 [Actinomycetota bacterium]|nr:hypothetical protein [Actinomycetota bacterium]
MIQVNYYKKESEYYLIILSFVESIDEIEENSVAAKVKYKDTEGWLIEGTNNQDFWTNFLNLFENKVRKKSRKLKVKKYKKLNMSIRTA